jgi:nucleoside 2-deoxyribosyltransferase
MKKIKIYLAGKMSGLTYEQMNNWRVEATNKIQFHDKNQGLYNFCIESPVNYYNFELDPASFSDHECKCFDLFLVQNCDIILVNLDFPDSIGTAIEIELASRFWNKPIVAFGTRENVHPWMKLAVTKQCKTMNEAIDHMFNFYFPNM